MKKHEKLNALIEKYQDVKNRTEAGLQELFKEAEEILNKAEYKRIAKNLNDNLETTQDEPKKMIELVMASVIRPIYDKLKEKEDAKEAAKEADRKVEEAAKKKKEEERRNRVKKQREALLKGPIKTQLFSDLIKIPDITESEIDVAGQKILAAMVIPKSHKIHLKRVRNNQKLVGTKYVEMVETYLKNSFVK